MSSLDTADLSSIQFLQRQAASLLLYRSVLSDPPGIAFLELLDALKRWDAEGLIYLQAYGKWFQAIAATNKSWQDYLIWQILRNDNPFTQQAQRQDFASLPSALVAAVQQDLQALQSLYECSGAELSCWVQEASKLPLAPVVWYREQDEISYLSDAEKKAIASLQELDNWTDAVEDLAAYYRECGTGILAEYQALRWQSGQLLGIAYPDTIKIKELAGYESQRDALMKNTEFLLLGYPALHVLLYGSRGSGKSSLVKGLLNEYANRNLRLIEVSKSDLKDLSKIVELLRNVPQKFIIFVDDLSFEEDDDAFKALKVVLEGNITARPQNVVVYATSNRRHLIREFFKDRPAPSDEEVHAWDTVQEKLSFSDRFGLTLTFEPADQKTYLTIVRHLAEQAGITLPLEELEYRALQWATRHNGRSGRTARQFVDYLKGELATLDG
ncbi:ATP-binding protein [Planktothrix sp. FACHB-1355]|uniref:ATP-binding protein n=1 Tax=Aerosakkonema funiforme FACHB-1375 TaxID=2949571 RepID=A0A926VAH7_9CYAN|nr:MULTISPECIES: ATP-binding protein [Oscillatoriales]MBD2180286.1 ATP-binding protein [Aerosakkonema funiforme FACHB-1375]MBD3558846.1 ATP-binding protein [Planktothrix sp. FACHB-1355]